MWHARGRLGAAVGTAAKWVHLNSATQICGVPLPAAARSRRADTIAASVVASVVAHDSLCTLRAGSRSSPAVHDALSTGMSASKSRQNSLSVLRWSVGCHACRPSAACASRSASTTRRRLTAPSTESHSRSSEATIAPLRRLPPKAIAVTAPSSKSHSRYGAFLRGHDRTDTAPSSESHSRSSEATIAPLCRGSCQR